MYAYKHRVDWGEGGGEGERNLPCGNIPLVEITLHIPHPQEPFTMDYLISSNLFTADSKMTNDYLRLS